MVTTAQGLQAIRRRAQEILSGAIGQALARDVKATLEELAQGRGLSLESALSGDPECIREVARVLGAEFTKHGPVSAKVEWCARTSRFGSIVRRCLCYVGVGHRCRSQRRAPVKQETPQKSWAVAVVVALVIVAVICAASVAGNVGGGERYGDRSVPPRLGSGRARTGSFAGNSGTTRLRNSDPAARWRLPIELEYEYSLDGLAIGTRTATIDRVGQNYRARYLAGR